MAAAPDACVVTEADIHNEFDYKPALPTAGRWDDILNFEPDFEMGADIDHYDDFMQQTEQYI